MGCFGEGMGKTIGTVAALAGIVGVLWLFRDKITGFFKKGDGSPGSAAADILDTPVPNTGDNLDVGDVAQMLTPGLGIVKITDVMSQALNNFLNKPKDEPITQDVSWFWENAVILGQTGILSPNNSPGAGTVYDPAAVAQDVAERYDPLTVGPLPKFTSRGESLTGVPLYKPTNELIRMVEVCDVWGDCRMEELRNISGNPWLVYQGGYIGAPIAPCYYQGGYWDWNANGGRGGCAFK